MWQIRRIKDETTDEAFNEQFYLLERGASVGVGVLTLKNFYLYKKSINACNELEWCKNEPPIEYVLQTHHE